MVVINIRKIRQFVIVDILFITFFDLLFDELVDDAMAITTVQTPLQMHVRCGYMTFANTLL